MLSSLTELYTHRDLMWELVVRELKLRYRRSVLGFLWSLLSPVYQMVIYTLVLKYIIRLDEPNLSVKMLSAIIPWTYFSVSVLSACASVLRFRTVVKKVYFPRQFLPISVVAANLLHLLFSLLVLFGIFIFIPVKFHLSFFFLAVLVILQTVLIIGLAMVFAAAHTYYGDVEFVLANLMQLFMFITPVLYPASRVLDAPNIAPLWKTLYMLNPMAVYCEGWRNILLSNQFPDPTYLATAALLSGVAFFVGLAVWGRAQWRFPEVL